MQLLGRTVSFLLAATLPLGVPAAPAQAAPAAAALPQVSPAPQQIQRSGPDLPVGNRVRLVVDERTDPAARALLERTLREHGVRHIDTAGRAPLTFHLGPADRPDVAAALGSTPVPSRAEGSALTVLARRGSVALGGVDPAGQYYAVQTLRQLFTGDRHRARIAGAAVSDFPAMALRGTIEGFYGSPWTHQERLDQLAFYGQVKANTYIYAPKDDPYHRDRWREPYPADRLAQLGELVKAAAAQHVRFTYALSPGTSICYSSAGDRAALAAKLQAMYDLGVRAFSIPLDDISYTRWNCAADRTAYGEPGRRAAGVAQVGLLNDLQRGFLAAHPGTHPLQMVPTEYGDLTDTEYKQVLRSTLDPAVLVMWTGTDVVPPSITVDQARRASELFGRKVFAWDNYPVNDFGQAAGRLLLAPYDHREPGLSGHLAGIVANPMNQAAASKVAVFTMADFSWHDHGYDRDRSWRAAAAQLAGGNPAGVRALLDFFDLNHLAPTFGRPWQPQAPALQARVDAFWAGAPGAASALRGHVRRITAAPSVIRATVADLGFLDDAANWLAATELWAGAMGAGLDTLDAIGAGDRRAAAAARERLDALAAKANRIRSVPGENRVEGVVRIGDGVLDVFLDRVRARHDEFLGLPPLRNLSAGRPATQISDYSADYAAGKSVDGDLFSFSTTSGAEPRPWWQVDLGAVADIESVRVHNRVDCCAERLADYHVLVSAQPFPDTLAEALRAPGVTSRHEPAQAGRPTEISLPARGRYVRVWLATDQPRELNMAEAEVFGRVRR
ncbi:MULTISPECIES: beta-N-acetylglucosaminidase domain-containing protein [unclassified Crossiella]|uniref:beta-N-acetylglucosaminidase domain-containing protein n=1 Tax=unclassified Crossiella TaxID=2620835 RepID=UPI001FFEAFF0|nr:MULTISPECIES: beta-N-acetylglucosaminidase domain-containing protein [unclassified Crossiella]MCK2244986.1 beta-N-acetylglucosaminidase domain-containing protein [Crossiella sp. S99.2]MCK2258711.1 beta-N-acetylglucosaminidase domain-containing protein [Crossiella sp. S99.1]